MNFNDKLLGGLYGLLIGDAVGTPYEFKSRNQIPPFHEIDMVPPEGYKKSWSEHPCGIWSDDGSQALCLLEYYTEKEDCKATWYDMWAMKLLRWQRGHLWVNGKSFDAGIQTQKALQNISNGAHPLHAGDISEYANGNGSLMRTLPVALWNLNMSTPEFIMEVENISHITHPHRRTKLCCVLYCEIARQLLHGKTFSDAMVSVFNDLHTHVKDDKEWKIILDGQFKEPTGSGYVVDALWSALMAIKTTDNYEDCIKTCIALGNDTDTTACIAGGLAGIIYGHQGIPQRWLAQLKGGELVTPLANKLIDRYTR